MREFDRPALRAFLEAVDAELPDSLDVVVIGGAAIALAYDPTHGTSDIDTLALSKQLPPEVCERARLKIGRQILVEVAGVAQAPDSFEERLVECGISAYPSCASSFPSATISPS